MRAEPLAASAAVTVTVIRVLASALKQDQHSATTQQSKKSEVAWRNRQAKAVLFARANCSPGANASSPPPDEFAVVNAPRLNPLRMRLAPTARRSIQSLGQRPRMHEQFQHISAEGAIHFGLISCDVINNCQIESRFQRSGTRNRSLCHSERSRGTP